MEANTREDLKRQDSSDDYTEINQGRRQANGTDATTDGESTTDPGAAETRLANADKQLELVADHLDDDLATSALERARIELAYARGHVAAKSDGEAER